MIVTNLRLPCCPSYRLDKLRIFSTSQSLESLEPHTTIIGFVSCRLPRRRTISQGFGQISFTCNEYWKAKNSKPNNVKDCERYRKEGWCTKDGDYGPNWNHQWGDFDDYAEKKCNWSKCRKWSKLPTALSCPQCGCRIVASDAPAEHRVKHKIFEVAGKTYVRVESYGWEVRFSDKLNWYTARERCQRLGYKHGDLASIPTYEEFEKVTREMHMEDSRCKYTWIGLKMDRSAADANDWQYKWLTGETVNSTHEGWASGRPKGKWTEKWRGKPRITIDPCVYVKKATQNEPAKMYETACDKRYPGVCTYLCQVSNTDDTNADDGAASDIDDDGDV